MPFHYLQPQLITATIFSAAFIKVWIAHIIIFAIQILTNHSKSFTESLEMHNFPCSQETNRIADFLVMNQA